MSRWLRIGSLAVGLLVVNVIARGVVRFGFDNDGEAQDRISLIMFGVVAAVIAVFAFRWGRERPLGTWLGDMAAAALIGCALTVLVAPLLFGGNPFAGGAGDFFAQIWLYAGFSIGGTLLGYLLLVVMGKDYRSKELARLARGGHPRQARRRETGPTRRRVGPDSRH